MTSLLKKTNIYGLPLVAMPSLTYGKP